MTYALERACLGVHLAYCDLLALQNEDYAAVLERFAEIMALKETKVVDDLRSGEKSSRLESPDIDGIADYIRHGKVKHIICM